MEMDINKKSLFNKHKNLHLLTLTFKDRLV